MFEARRLLARPGAWIAVALVSLYATSALFIERDAVARGSSVDPSAVLGAAVGLQTLWLLVLVLPMAIGGTLADDRASGYLSLQLTRGVPRSLVAVSRLFAAVLTALATTVASVVVVLCVAAAAGPVLFAPVGQAVSFAPELLDTRPLLWVLTVIAIYTVAAASVLGSSMFVGLWFHALASRIMPPVSVVASAFVFVGRLTRFSPFERVSFLQIFDADWAAPIPMLIYWGIAWAVVACVVTVCVSAKEG
ncbi:MAG: hypothetical protein FWE94_03345 [Coriobacteriia bacterium]|nr:hypothetical protein [Coriobacteriia bacterium]